MYKGGGKLEKTGNLVCGISGGNLWVFWFVFLSGKSNEYGVCRGSAGTF